MMTRKIFHTLTFLILGLCLIVLTISSVALAWHGLTLPAGHPLRGDCFLLMTIFMFLVGFGFFFVADVGSGRAYRRHVHEEAKRIIYHRYIQSYQDRQNVSHLKAVPTRKLDIDA